MSLTALAIIILLVLAATGWFALWTAEDKLKVQGFEIEDMTNELGWCAATIADRDERLADAVAVGDAWRRQAKDMETSYGLLDRELERAGLLSTGRV